MGAVTINPNLATTRFHVHGLTCGSCVRRVESALTELPGVYLVEVELASSTAVVQYDLAVAPPEALQRAMQAAGYQLDVSPSTPSVALPWRPLLFGAVASLGVLAFYVGVLTLAQGWSHALQQFAEDRWFVGIIATGFGTQMGLFTFLRGLQARLATGGIAASTGTSATAMLACCAHHVTDVLPVLGLSSAAIFLNLYKTPLLWLGIVMNLVGVLYLLRQVRRQRQVLCHTDVPIRR